MNNVSKDMNSLILNDNFSNCVLSSSFQKLSLVNNSNNSNIEIDSNSNIILNLLVDSYDNFEINVNCKENSTFEFWVADISLNNSNIKININLNGENSKGEIHFCSISDKNNLKKYSFNVNHNSQFTSSKILFNSVSKDNGDIKVNAITHIKENMKKSNASQNIRIILLDENSKGSGNPVLKIDNNDIKANHGCAIGNIKESDLFYLLSRGINEKDAKKLIVLGNLIPIINNFDEENKEKFMKYIGDKI